MSIIKMQASDGSDIYIEVRDTFDITEPEAMQGGGTVAGVEDNLNKFQRVGQQIMRVCNEVYSQYRAATIAMAPDELELKFSIKLAGKMGIPLVTEGSAESNFEVTAKWNKPAQ
jgi:hypothetical protein